MDCLIPTGIYLLLAILFEVAGITAMKLSDGFTFVLPSICIFIFYAFSFGFLAFSLRKLEVSFAYAVWSGVGTLLVAIIGFFFFHEVMTWIKVFSLGLIIVGVLGLKAA
jgi:small multidrug resistance pump